MCSLYLRLNLKDRQDDSTVFVDDLYQLLSHEQKPHGLRDVRRNFERGFYFIYVRKAHAKFLARPTFIPFMAIVTINMISGRPPVCVI